MDLNLNDEKIWFSNLILMFQKEVADRIISNLILLNYGRLSILANWKLNIKKILILNQIVFHQNQK
jgi:16S rRNA (adenine1518-N6/adenine1519-N6)-dimethyltransferase